MPLPERLKDLSVKNWTQLAGSGPVPWRQAPTLFNSSIPQSELHPRVSYEVDLSTSIDRLNAGERLTTPSLEKRKIEDFSERLMNGGLKGASRDILENGNTGSNCFPAFSMSLQNYIILVTCYSSSMLEKMSSGKSI